MTGWLQRYRVMRTFSSAEERQEINEQSMRADESEGIQWLRNKSYRQVRRILSARETSDRLFSDRDSLTQKGKTWATYRWSILAAMDGAVRVGRGATRWVRFQGAGRRPG